MGKLRVLDLFSGIGGFSLGLERTGGFETVAFCEIEEFPRRVLAKHWPQVRQYDDVRTLTAERLAADGIAVDAICGGFPCQDISHAGAGAGIGGARSGLWAQYARLIGELRPGVVIVENVAALLGRGLDRVLGDLAALRYDAEWHCIPAAAIGAPHIRDRVWVVAHPQRPDADSVRSYRAQMHLVGSAELRDEQVSEPGSLGEALAHPDSARLEGRSQHRERSKERPAGEGSRSVPGRWIAEPNVGRVANGVPNRVDRLKALGNAVVPQIPEIIGRAILESMRQAA